MYTPEYDLTDKSWRRNIKNSFPGFMNQKPHSNNQKILWIISQIFNVYKNDVLAITDQMNINNASGQILTDIANDYGVTRIDDDDSFLRFMVKFQLWKSTMGANRNDFNNILQFMLGLTPNQYSVIQTGLKEFKITNVPWQFDNGNKSKLKRDMISSIIQYVAPPEYKIDYIEYVNNTPNHLYTGVSVNKSVLKRVFPKAESFHKKTNSKTNNAHLGYQYHHIFKRVYPKPMSAFRKFFSPSFNNHAGYKVTNNFRSSKEEK